MSTKEKKEENHVWNYYQVKGTTLVRTKKECPRCGKGVFLGEHSDRQSCGKCGYTIFRKR